MKLHNYQADCLEFLKKTPQAGIFADPGLGKTAIVLHRIDQLYWRSKRPFRTLIIAPLRVCYSVWPQEIEKWKLGYLSYSILHGNGKTSKSNADIDILNVENIFWFFENPREYDLLVIDESSKFKNYASKRFWTLKKYLHYFKCRIILTGTPTPNTLMDLYSQIYILDAGKTLGKNITAYRKRFFYPTNYRNFIEWNLRSNADKEIQKQISPIVQRIDASTHLDLPDLIEHEIKIQLPPKIQKIYRDFERELFAQLDDEKFVLASSAMAYNVCRQIANGSLYKPPQPLLKTGNKEVLTLHRLKIEALRELLDELQGKPALIAYHYKHDLLQLQNEFGSKTPNIGGGISAKQSAQIIDRWNKGEIPILLGHPQSMSHGINLQQGGHDVIWFSLTDNLENYLQFNRRIYRQGVSGQVRIHHILADKTIDLAIMQRLRQKDKTQNALLNALKEYRDEN